MKIIFLDFDDVMDTSYYDHVLHKEGNPRLLVINPFNGLDEDTANRAIELLNSDFVV